MCAYHLVPKEILPDVCPQLKQLRLERNLSLEELSDAVRISIKMLKRIENNKCLCYSQLRRLLDFYGKKVRIVIED